MDWQLKNGFFAWQRDWVFLVTAAVAVLLHVAGPNIAALLRFDRAEVQVGQIWRLLTGNFLHLGTAHLLLNVSALALVGFVGRGLFSGLNWLAILFVALLGTGAGLYVLSPAVTWYVGLSGALHGLVMAMCVAMRSNQPLGAVSLAVLVVAKLAWEQWQGALPMTSEMSGGPVVVDAHLYGSLAGFLAALSCTWWSHRRNRGATL